MVKREEYEALAILAEELARIVERLIGENKMESLFFSIDVQIDETSEEVSYHLLINLPDDVVARKFLFWPLSGVAKFLICQGVKLLGINAVVNIQ
jgi:hypothetical protein